MSRTLLIGIAAIALLAGAAVWLLSGLDGASPAAPPAASATAAAPDGAQGASAIPDPPAGPSPDAGEAGPTASDRDPRADVQQDHDPRGDALLQERAARVDSAMDQLNRRSRRRAAAMNLNGEVRPTPVAPPGQPSR